MARVTITIASMGRPTLARTLASLSEMYVPPDVVVAIIIADDTRNGAVRRLLDGTERPKHPVRCLSVGAGNVSIARNACLDAADGDLIAFVDDDEWVARDWLVKMLGAMAEFDADAVFGPVFPQYPADTPAWIRVANPLFTEWGHRGKRVTIGRCGNTLVKRHVIERHRLRFDAAHGQIGAEDTDFFHRLHGKGARLVVTDDAHILEDAPPHRLTLRHFRLRAVRKGQLYARFRVATTERGVFGRTLFYAGAGAKTVAGLGAACALAPVSRASALKMAMRGWMNLGKLRELFGLAPPQWT
jgi:succinoglycan biosynthesis protein ExoM